MTKRNWSLGRQDILSIAKMDTPVCSDLSCESVYHGCLSFPLGNIPRRAGSVRSVWSHEMRHFARSHPRRPGTKLASSAPLFPSGTNRLVESVSATDKNRTHALSGVHPGAARSGFISICSPANHDSDSFRAAGEGPWPSFPRAEVVGRGRSVDLKFTGSEQ